MRTTILILTFVSFLIAGAYANNFKANTGDLNLNPGEKKTEAVKVYGNCGMCKTRIEKAAKSEDGVSKAKWDQKKKELTVTFDPSVTNLEDIEKEVAGVGHDTENVRAEDEVYNKLHSCCKYERPEKK